MPDENTPSAAYLRSRAEALRRVLEQSTGMSPEYAQQLRKVIEDLEARAAQLDEHEPLQHVG